jgi:hypothetical protein
MMAKSHQKDLQMMAHSHIVTEHHFIWSSKCKGYDQHENVDYPAYKLLPEARPLVMNLMAYVGGE